MSLIPQIQIAQQYSKIGIDADLGKQSIQQPRPELNIETTQIQTSLSFESLLGDLKIDQSRAFDALGVGDHMATMKRIYQIAHSRGLEGIAKIVEKGNEMANIAGGNNAIADIAQREANSDYPPNFDFAGEPSYDNVDITYTPRHPDINFNGGTLDISAKINAPIVSYERGKVDIYLKQRNSIDITPPQIDVKR